ncbi:putative methyltransferase-like protein 24 [Brachyhypopomus gauderio]|uniref:putative methyltransferase-like protein 24 n=1 Tax=Brachyhypopomus gauderio TaxID=698409 RepID=UPI00404232DF
MATCNIGGVRLLLPPVVMIGLSTLLLLQLVISLVLLRTSPGPDEQPVFTVINIKGVSRTDESVWSEASIAGRLGLSGSESAPELWAEDESAGLGAYADENEPSSRQVSERGLVLQPWASEKPSFSTEVNRLTQFITTPEVNCSRWQRPDGSQPAQVLEGSEALCMHHWTGGSSCVVYSFSLDEGDAVFLERALKIGCEVHRFDPRRRVRSSSGSGSGSIQHHQAWLDWRHPRSNSHRGALGTLSRRLADIMNSLGHRTVDVLWADLESAEWRVLESWTQDGTLGRIGQLILTIHLQWAGFEVGGNEVEVVRFWYSVLRALHSSGFFLTHFTYGAGHTVLRHELLNAHSSYTLNWVGMSELLNVHSSHSLSWVGMSESPPYSPLKKKN